MRWILILMVVLVTQSFGIQSGWVVQDASVIEGDDGTTQMFFTVSISATSPEPLEVSYSTSDGTAKEGIDYIKATGSFILPAGMQSHPVVVSVVNDHRNIISNKFFYLSLTSKNLPLFKGKAKGVIIDNDPPQSAKEHKETKSDTTKGKL